MLDGEHYTQMSADGKKIIQYSFKTGKETGTIHDVNTARDCSIKSFDDYIMSPDEKLILILIALGLIVSLPQDRPAKTDPAKRAAAMSFTVTIPVSYTHLRKAVLTERSAPHPPQLFMMNLRQQLNLPALQY